MLKQRSPHGARTRLDLAMVPRKDKLRAVGWLLFHSIWVVLSVIDPGQWVGAYALSFAGLEAVGLYFGAPFTRYVHGLMDWARRERSTLKLAVTASAILGWCGWFAAAFRDYGWFDPFTNTVLAAGFFIYILPHFFGRYW